MKRKPKLLSKKAQTIIQAIDGMTEIEAVTYVVKNAALLDAQEVLILLGSAVRNPHLLKPRYEQAQQYTNGWRDADAAWDDAKLHQEGGAVPWAEKMVKHLESMKGRTLYHEGTLDALKKALERD